LFSDSPNEDPEYATLQPWSATNNAITLNTNGETLGFATPYTVVIERTTDFVSWVPIFTNQVATNTVNNFTDSNPPPQAAFYRVGWQ
jgi:hypothetical protein